MDAWMKEFMALMNQPWVIIGLLGQALFFSRWIIQWIVSEKNKKSIVPLSFWIISLAGGILILAYAIQRHDPVFILGQSIGIANYTRNIMLTIRHPPEPGVT